MFSKKETEDGSFRRTENQGIKFNMIVDERRDALGGTFAIQEFDVLERQKDSSHGLNISMMVRDASFSNYPNICLLKILRTPSSSFPIKEGG